MMRSFGLLAPAALFLLTGASPPPAPALLPTPATIDVAGAGFVLAAETPVVAQDEGARAAAVRLAGLMASAGVPLPDATARSDARVAIRLRRVAGIPAEGYRLNSGPEGATIEASDDAGLLYGAVTLWQLATQPGATGRVAGVRIADAPRFRWRGLMLDSARHFQTVAYIHHLLDWMVANKLNRLHWHLVDDQGWRLPVPGWPRLTSVAAWRRGATAPGAPPLPREGGFYTEAEIRGVVAAAAERGITIVPEIEMPGHALAAIRAYPQLGMGVPIPAGTESDYGVFPWLYNTQEPTFRFLENALDQVIKLFPGEAIHLGGDEAVKDQWRADPAIQAQIKTLGLKNEDALQGWFMARLGRYLQQHGRRMIGWDEILDGGVPANATVTSWRGIEGAVTAAKAGHDAILSPAPVLYLDNRQGTGPDEPPGRGTLITLADVLAFDPMPAGLSPEQQRHIIGLQANLWTEHVRTEGRAAWMTFPRATAVAEIGWAGATKRDVAGFTRTLAPQLRRMRPLGLVAADSAWAVLARYDVAGRDLTATLSGQSGLPIRYTLDGSAPTAASPAYTAPIALSGGQRLRAATFGDDAALPGGLDATPTRADALTRTSRQLALCSNAVPLDLEDDWPAKGARAHFLLDIFNPCWRWDAAPLDQARRVAISVGQLPFNFQVGADRAKIHFAAPRTPAGEFELRAGCGGALLTTLPLARAARHPGVTRLEAVLPAHAQPVDLCITYTAHGVDPLWAVERIELLP